MGVDGAEVVVVVDSVAASAAVDTGLAVVAMLHINYETRGIIVLSFILLFPFYFQGFRLPSQRYRQGQAGRHTPLLKRPQSIGVRGRKMSSSSQVILEIVGLRSWGYWDVH